MSITEVLLFSGFDNPLGELASQVMKHWRSVCYRLSPLKLKLNGFGDFHCHGGSPIPGWFSEWKKNIYIDDSGYTYI